MSFKFPEWVKLKNKMSIEIWNLPLAGGENFQDRVNPELCHIGHDEDPGQVKAAEGSRRKHANEPPRVDVIGEAELKQLKRMDFNVICLMNLQKLRPLI